MSAAGVGPASDEGALVVPPAMPADDPGLLSAAQASLLIDQYELTMAASYLERGMNEPAIFELFVRELPPGRDWLVHGDFHHHNVLRHEGRYVAIDPKPYSRIASTTCTHGCTIP